MLQSRLIYVLSFILGGLASLALPPAGMMPAIFFLSAPVFWSVKARSGLHAGLCFGMAGWGWFTCSLYWIGSSFIVKGGVELFFLPFGVFGLPFILSLFWALAAALAVRLSAFLPVRLAWLCLFWGGAEWLRSVILTGFPWNVLSHIFLDWPAAAQMVSVMGQHGLNFLVAGLVAGGAGLYLRAFRLAGFLLLPVIAGIAFGNYRLATAPAVAALSDQVDMRLIQPSISQREKWDRSKRPDHIETMMSLAAAPPHPARLTILPEVALAGFWHRDFQDVRQMATVMAGPDGLFVTGILSADSNGHLQNSAIFTDGYGQRIGQYDKQHLVPFGEYVPFRWLPFVNALAGRGEFSAGTAAQPLILEPFGHVRMLICYEVIFPDFIARDQQRPDFLITISNDAWFGRTSGPYQHFAQARFRALEEGLAIYRVANTGLSGGFDAYGRLLGRTELGQRTALDLPFARPLEAPFYARNRKTGILIISMIFALTAFWLEIQGQKRNNN